jgi:RNA polymerase sigma factor (sigma-70 family)
MKFAFSHGLPIFQTSINNCKVNQLSQEKELLKGLANNNPSAIETIYRDCFAVVQKLVINNNGTHDDAKDVFQEALIVLYEKAKTENFELTSQIRTYVYSVCRRLWLKRLQGLQRFGGTPVESLEEIVPVEDDLEEHQAKSLQYQSLEKAMSSLGEPCKSLIDAYYLQKKHMQEIAEEFGYTNADNAKNQKYKCLMRLKKIFFAQYKNGN